MPTAPSNDDKQGRADLPEGGGSHDQHEEHDADVFMDDAPQADAETERIPTENIIEAEATANDASQTAKAPETLAETDQAVGKAAYENLERASDAGSAERVVVQVQQQPKQAEAPPKPVVVATSSTFRPPVPTSTMVAAIPIRDPHLLIKTAEKMVNSAAQWAENAKSNALLMKGTAQVNILP